VMDQPKVLLIVCDTLKADHLGCYGYFRETSLNIDRIASEGVLFEDFYNAGSPTGPGFTCIYTGLHTIHHKYYRFGEPNLRQVDDTIFTMPEIMRAMGYTTAGFDNLMNLIYGRSKHFVRGYEFYVNCGPDTFDSAHYLRAEQLNHRLIPWVKNYSDEKFFLFIHYWDPHLPYNQPEEYKRLFHHEPGNLSDLEVCEALAGYKYVPGWGKVGEFADGEVRAPYGPYPTVSIDHYDGEIAYMDHAIGEVLEALDGEGILDQTMVIVTSDHGEQFGQHSGYGWEHDGLHDAVTHLPLIIRYPMKLPKGVKIGGFCQQIDILPTILDLLNVQPENIEIDGKSVMPLLKGEKIRSEIFMEHTSGQRAIRTDQWKLLDDELHDEEWKKRPHRGLELFNVKNDPMEMINLAKTETDKAEALRATLHGWVKTNLKEGETDPAIYKDWGELHKKSLEYRQKTVQLLDSLKET